MIEEFPWFDRKFAFDSLAVWMYPNIVERLRGTPARAEEATAALDRAVLTRKMGDSWSIQESVGHLWDLEALWLGRLDDVLSGKEMMREADLSNTKTEQANHNANAIATILAGFRSERMQFVARLDELDENDALRSAIHPRLKQPMRVLDMAFFIAEHDDHHLAEVARLKRSFS